MLISAIIPDRCIDEPGRTLERANFMETTTALKAAIHGQELRGLTFHNSRST
jgi:hypothetical protein